jgi:hypothetical protein
MADDSKHNYFTIHKMWIFIMIVLAIFVLICTWNIEKNQSDLVPMAVSFIGGGEYVRISDIPYCADTDQLPCRVDMKVVDIINKTGAQ